MKYEAEKYYRNDKLMGIKCGWSSKSSP